MVKVSTEFLIRFLLLLLPTSSNIQAQTKSERDEEKKMINQVQTMEQQTISEAVNGWWKVSMRNHDERKAWWREARFGMFIHWGIYSLAAGEWNGKNITGYAEHLMRKEKIRSAAKAGLRME